MYSCTELIPGVLHMHVNAEAFVWYTVVYFLALGTVFAMALTNLSSFVSTECCTKANPKPFTTYTFANPVVLC
jgi:hypothetical protein